jgi:hypothetical protein
MGVLTGAEKTIKRPFCRATIEAKGRKYGFP